MRTLALLLALTLPAVADAHEVWIERDATGPARIYLGEPAEPMPVGGDPEFPRLVAPRIVAAGNAPLVRKAGFLEAAVPAGDVRATDDGVFAPWGEPTAREAVVYYARAGRGEAATRMPYEIAPLDANGTRFALMQAGKPIPAAKITVVSPDKWTKVLTADANGAITVPSLGAGRYLLSATHVESGQLRVPAGPVAKIHHTATTTFVAP